MEFDVQISLISREAQVLFIIYGVPIIENSADSIQTNQPQTYDYNIPNAQRIAFTSTPLYNYEGYQFFLAYICFRFFLQGPILLPLRDPILLPTMNRKAVHSWGPRALVLLN